MKREKKERMTEVVGVVTEFTTELFEINQVSLFIHFKRAEKSFLFILKSKKLLFYLSGKGERGFFKFQKGSRKKGLF